MTAIFFSLLFSVACKKKPEPTPKVIEKPKVEEPKPEPKKEPKIETEIIEKLSANFQKIYFELDQSTLNEESKRALDENVEIMQKETDLKIEIQGHADERGTTEYNVSLGQQRAERVAKYFTAQGVASSRIKIVSYGEEKPSDLGGHEGAWSKNRRCEFIIIWSENPNIKGSAD